MSNYNYPSNSDKKAIQPPTNDKAPKPKVISGTVSIKPTTKRNKITNVFIAEDVANVREYVWNSVMVPMIKRGLTDIVDNGCNLLTDAFSMLINGRPAHQKSSTYGTAYDRCFVRVNQNEPFKVQPKQTPRIQTDFSFDNRRDAEVTLQSMRNQINEYGSVTVSDLYEFVGRTPPEDWQAWAIGWKDLSNAWVDNVRGEYHLILPNVKQLGR